MPHPTSHAEPETRAMRRADDRPNCLSANALRSMIKETESHGIE